MDAGRQNWRTGSKDGGRKKWRTSSKDKQTVWETGMKESGRQNWTAGSEDGGRQNWKQALGIATGRTGEEAVRMAADKTGPKTLLRDLEDQQ
jgi:hypothetical protein